MIEPLQVDFSTLLAPGVVGIMAWLIRGTFRQFGEKLDSVVADVKEGRMVQDGHGNRLTALETAVSGWHPVRRKTDLTTERGIE